MEQTTTVVVCELQYVDKRSKGTHPQIVLGRDETEVIIARYRVYLNEQL